MHCWHSKCIHRIECPCEAPYSCDYESGFCINTCPPTGCPYPYTCINGLCGYRPCKFKWDCKSRQEICPNGYCKPTCTYDSDCRSGFRCLGGSCIRVCTQVGGCPERYYCNPEGQCVEPQCRYSYECNNDEYCRYGKCVKKLCQRDSDCESGYRCPSDLLICIKKSDECSRCEEMNMECVKRQFGSRIYVSCEISITCQWDRDCPENMRCGWNKICKSDECSKKYPCGDGLFCYNGQCVPPYIKPPVLITERPTVSPTEEPNYTTEALDTTEKTEKTETPEELTTKKPPIFPPVYCDPMRCRPGQWCKNNRCIYPDCTDDSGCQYPKRCYYGMCKLPCDPKICPGKCIRETCVICIGENNCKPKPPPYIVCYINSQCPPPLVCRDGMCIQIICKKNGDCPPQQACKEGVCIFNFRNDTREACKSNKDCTKNEVCKNSKCQPQCTTASECAIGVPCIKKMCATSRCKFDVDCGPMKHCSDGECIVVKRCSEYSNNNLMQCIYGRWMREKKCQGFDCDDGYECRQGKICLPKDVKCKGDSHCAEMSKCGSYEKCILRQCIVDSDCFNLKTRECISGLCVPRLPCVFHTDCNGIQKCIGGVCKVEPPPPTCSDDSECPPELGHCKNGICRSPPCKSVKDCCKQSPKSCYFECKNGKCESTTIICRWWLCPSKKCNEFKTSCLEDIPPPFNDTIICPLGYSLRNKICVPPVCYDRCPNPAEICMYGKCIRPEKPLCFCSNGEPCKNEACPPEPPPPPCERDQNCMPPFYCDPMTGTCVGRCKKDSDCQQGPDDSVKYICKDNNCIVDVLVCETDCPKPGYMCQNKRCKKIECRDIWDCGPRKTCFLGICITHVKVSQCAADEKMEANRTLHCLPTEIYTSTNTETIEITETKITCRESYDCPRDMSCKNKKCSAKICIDSVDKAPESTVDGCDQHKMCFRTIISGNKKEKDICLPVFPCDNDRCSAPIKPKVGTYMCHKYHKKCYVSIDECHTDYDCMDKGEGKYICALDEKKQQKICLRIDCSPEIPCTKTRPTCFNLRCQSCVKCKNNQDCPVNQQCLGAKKDESGCCVRMLTCPPAICNELFSKETGDYCLAGVCTLCYRDQGNIHYDVLFCYNCLLMHYIKNVSFARKD